MGQRAFAFSALALVTRCKLPLKSRGRAKPGNAKTKKPPQRKKLGDRPTL